MDDHQYEFDDNFVYDEFEEMARVYEGDHVWMNDSVDIEAQIVNAEQSDKCGYDCDGAEQDADRLSNFNLDNFIINNPISQSDESKMIANFGMYETRVKSDIPGDEDYILHTCVYCGNVWDGFSQCTCNFDND
jgi:hypothetical protein